MILNFGLVDGETCAIESIRNRYNLSWERIRQLRELALKGIATIGSDLIEYMSQDYDVSGIGGSMEEIKRMYLGEFTQLSIDWFGLLVVGDREVDVSEIQFSDEEVAVLVMLVEQGYEGIEREELLEKLNSMEIGHLDGVVGDVDAKLRTGGEKLGVLFDGGRYTLVDDVGAVRVRVKEQVVILKEQLVGMERAIFNELVKSGIYGVDFQVLAGLVGLSESELRDGLLNMRGKFEDLGGEWQIVRNFDDQVILYFEGESVFLGTQMAVFDRLMEMQGDVGVGEEYLSRELGIDKNRLWLLITDINFRSDETGFKDEVFERVNGFYYFRENLEQVVSDEGRRVVDARNELNARQKLIFALVVEAGGRGIGFAEMAKATGLNARQVRLAFTKVRSVIEQRWGGQWRVVSEGEELGRNCLMHESEIRTINYMGQEHITRVDLVGRDRQIVEALARRGNVGMRVADVAALVGVKESTADRRLAHLAKQMKKGLLGKNLRVMSHRGEDERYLVDLIEARQLRVGASVYELNDLFFGRRRLIVEALADMGLARPVELSVIRKFSGYKSNWIYKKLRVIREDIEALSGGVLQVQTVHGLGSCGLVDTRVGVRYQVGGVGVSVPEFLHQSHADVLLLLLSNCGVELESKWIGDQVGLSKPQRSRLIKYMVRLFNSSDEYKLLVFPDLKRGKVKLVRRSLR